MTYTSPTCLSSVRRAARRAFGAPQILAGLLCAATLVTGCESSPDPVRAAAAAEPGGPAGCPNPSVRGIPCLGRLDPDTTHSTRAFTPSFTYQVPTPGWVNHEDDRGGYLLVPPDNDPAGVDAGTSDFIGVATAMTPARVSDPHGCAIEALPGPWTPTTVAAWFRKQPNLQATRPTRTSVGGLQGVVLDLRTKPGAKLEQCTAAPGVQLGLAGITTGLPPSEFDHAVIPGMTMRVFLLAHMGKVLLVELDDIHAAPGDLAGLTAVARGFQFSS
jgi:hypothetical protein